MSAVPVADNPPVERSHTMAPRLMDLQDLLVDQLRDLLYAEKQIIKALPAMAKQSSRPELRSAIETHVDETKGQVNRLGQVFEQLGLSARGKRCEAMDGLIEEARSLMEEDAEPAVLDAGLIASAQKVEHYEIASYGCCATWAQQLGLEPVARLLEQTLNEEKQADRKLTAIAEQNVNRQAATVGAGSRR
jgi:ferritin-like metal-binding protein YciE